jgi:protein tyrosine phosphatase
MIAQEKVSLIVMLTGLKEDGKKKCTQYWPNLDSSREYTDVTVGLEKSFQHKCL